MQLFVTGIGTGIGKTYVSAILTEALKADYWKPVQAGYEPGTDSEWVKSMLSNTDSVVHAELYKLKKPASPHIAAREENNRIDLDKIVDNKPATHRPLVMEGAGGLMVPLNEDDFVSDLILRLGVPVILVSRNMLGSINHSVLTAMACKKLNIRVLGWIFNDNYLDYENEIVKWTGIPSLASIPFQSDPDAKHISKEAARIREQMKNWQW